MHAKLASCLAYRTTCEKTVLSFPSSLRPASASALSSTRETLPFKPTSLSLPPRDTIIALVHVVVGGDTRRRYHGSKIEIYSSQGGATRSNKRFHTSLSSGVNQSKGRESRRTRSRNIRSARTMPTLVDRRVV